MIKTFCSRPNEEVAVHFSARVCLHNLASSLLPNLVIHRFRSFSPGFALEKAVHSLISANKEDVELMAYHQAHDPYYHQQEDNYYAGNTSVVPDLPPVQQAYHQEQNHNNYDTHSIKSYQTSGYSESQVHLNPQYEMSQVSVHNTVPPVPSMPYAFAPNYPPQGRPIGAQREMSNGYSIAREKMLKRRSMKQVELVNGNLVLDVPVPSHITPKGRNDTEEMCKMRYTAATCDPDEFMRRKYTLRPYLYGRHTELFIVMTMYNEDEILFVKTMNALVFLSLHLISDLNAKLLTGSSKILPTCVDETAQRCGARKGGRRSSSASFRMVERKSTRERFKSSILWDASKRAS